MRPLILVTNDDGIESPGLAAAVEAAAKHGEVIVVAPLDQQTSTGRCYSKTPTTGRITRYEKFKSRNVLGVFGVEGTPATVVSHAILELVPRRPDLCVSGINYGENVGLSIAASGTVGAAFEADTYDVPALALSLECPISEQKSDEFNSKTWEPSVSIAERLIQHILKNGLPPRVACWNVNIPSDATRKTAIVFVRQSRLNYFEFVKPTRASLSDPARLHAEVRLPVPLNDPGSDIEALVANRVVSICELTWDQSVRATTGPCEL